MTVVSIVRFIRIPNEGRSACFYKPSTALSGPDDDKSRLCAPIDRPDRARRQCDEAVPFASRCGTGGASGPPARLLD